MYKERGIKSNNKGAVPVSAYVFIAVAALIFLIILIFSAIALFDFSVKGGVTIDTSSTSWGEVLKNNDWSFLDYLVGEHPDFMTELEISPTGSVIIIFAMWLILILTFGDILATFGTFDKWIGWTVGILMGIIAANLKVVMIILGFFIGVMGIFGGLAVIVGIGTAFIAFLAANFGIRWFGGWIMERRIMTNAAKVRVETEAGGTEIAGTIQGLREIQKEFKETGQQNQS